MKEETKDIHVEDRTTVVFTIGDGSVIWINIREEKLVVRCNHQMVIEPESPNSIRVSRHG